MINLKRNLFLLVVIVLFGFSTLNAQATKWIAIGNLHTWFSEAGSEMEIGRTGETRDQQDGMRWPAQFSVQDNQAAKAMWIGATNYYDPLINTTFNYKVVMAGPREVDIASQTIPLDFTLYGKFDHPNVTVDQTPATDMQYTDLVNENAPNMEADRVLVNEIQTSMGVKITRTIYAFSQQYHDNYFIYDYVLENNGVYNKSGDSHSQTLEGVYLFLQYRYAVSREGCVYDGNWLPQSAAWGRNTLNDVIGETPSSPNYNDYFYTSDNEIMRARYSWHGLHSGATFNNIGGPNVKDDGHLGAAQFIGSVTLHADKSPTDASDDINQPSTTQFTGSDQDYNQFGMDQFNPVRMEKEYAQMAAGHPARTHAEEVYNGNPSPTSTAYADQWGTDGGGYSQAEGFGPYTLAPGEKVHIIVAEGVAGLSREKCYEIGANWINDTPDLLPDGSETTDSDDYKNYWVYTGIDSLLQTFERARVNYMSGFNIPQPPPPPSFFDVTGAGDRIVLKWDSNAESHANFDGYKIFRAIHKPDTTYEEIYDGTAGINQFDDVTAIRGFDYYYYIISYDDGTTNDIQPGVSLTSSKFYTMTNSPASLKRLQGQKMSDIRIVPNPYNIRAKELQYGTSAPDRIMFLDIPGKCTIRIFTERGDLVKTIHHEDLSGDQSWNSETDSRQLVVSGLYIAHFEVTEDINDAATGEIVFRKGESAVKKFIIIR
ncbi:MAG: fibronectin [Candidatus Marinimicrobia bacterium]|nr:fibronectin [Candidatus Neomarinimicrobiota bacterium]